MYDKTRRRQSNCPCLYGNKNKLTSRVARHLHLRASPFDDRAEVLRRVCAAREREHQRQLRRFILNAR